jgi:hypothetical protein
MIPSSAIRYDSGGEDDDDDEISSSRSTTTTIQRNHHHNNNSRLVTTNTTINNHTPQRIDAFIEELGGWIEASIILPDDNTNNNNVIINNNNNLNEISSMNNNTNTNNNNNSNTTSRNAGILLQHQQHYVRLDNGEIYAPTDIGVAGTRSFQPNKRPQPGQIVDVLDVTPTSAIWETGVIVSVLDDRISIRILHDGIIVRVPLFSARLRIPFHHDDDDDDDNDDEDKNNAVTNSSPHSQSIPPSSSTTIITNNQAGNKSLSTTINSTTSSSSTTSSKRILEDFNAYSKSLYDIGLRLVRVQGDGNCLYRAISHQIYGTDIHHALVRKACADFMELERAQFEPFTAPNHVSYEAYISKTRQNTAWADHPQVQALCEVYERPVEVYAYESPATTPAATTATHSATTTTTIGLTMNRIVPMEHSLESRPPIRLSFFGGGHYDSIVSCSISGNSGSSSSSDVNNKYPTPGVLESRAKSLAEIRQAGGVGKGKIVSDVLATENATVQAILSASQREDVEKRLLETALEESLQQFNHVSINTSNNNANNHLKNGDQQQQQQQQQQQIQNQNGLLIEEDDMDDALLQMAIQQSLDDS